MRIKKINKKNAGEFLRFVLVGILSTLIHYSLYYVLMSHVNVYLAYSFAYFISFLLNFLLSSFFTFKVKPDWLKLFGMVGAHIVNYLIHLGLLRLVLMLGVDKVFAPIPVLAIAVPLNFLMVRFVFKSKDSKNENK